MANAVAEVGIERRIDQGVMGALAIGGSGARTPTFQSMRDVMEFAKVMAVSGIAIRKHLRGNPGACLAITMQAQRWEMDAFTVGNKSYEVNDQLAYESQLITAVVNTRAPIKGRLKTRFVGEGQKRKCVAWATFEGEDEPTEVTSPELGSIKPKNSPLWTTDPDQQLAYYTKRLWARRECPEVLLGVYDIDEVDTTPRGPETARDVTPARPTLAQFAASEESHVDPATAGHEDLDARFRATTAETVDADGVIHDAKPEGPASAKEPASVSVTHSGDGAPDERATEPEANPAKAGSEAGTVAPGYDAEAVRDSLWEGALDQRTVVELDEYWGLQKAAWMGLLKNDRPRYAELLKAMNERRAALAGGSGK